MSDPFFLDVLKDVAKDAIVDVFKQMFDLVEMAERAMIQATLNDQLDALPAGQGLLVQYYTFRDADGNTQRYGPVLLGQADAPYKPFLDTYQKRADLATFGDGLRTSLQRTDLNPTGHIYYWAYKLPNGRIDLTKADPVLMHQAAFNMKVSLDLQADFAEDQSGVKKMVEQSKYFGLLEAQYADKIDRAGKRARLAQLDARMVKAQEEFKKAASDRKKAIEKSKRVSAIQMIGQLAGVVEGLTGALDKLTAEKDYATSAGNQARATYNATFVQRRETYVDLNIDITIEDSAETITEFDD